MSVIFGFLAHAAPINYRFPIPTSVYAVGAGAVVLLSAPAAALAVGRERPVRRTRNFYPSIRPLRLGAIGLALSSALVVFCLVGGFAAFWDPEARAFIENPATVLIWVDFWVGLGIVSALIGNVWDFVSPLSALARGLDAALARRGTPRKPYPTWLGQWPAVGLLFVWSWMELVWSEAKEPQFLVLFLLGYFALTLAGSAIWGVETWLANVEMFTVFARTFARFAPLDFAPSNPDKWLRTDPDDRAVRLRPYGAGLRGEERAPPGAGAFVVTLLATVVYDGFSRTKYFYDFENWFLTQSPGTYHRLLLFLTLFMAVIVVLFVLAFLLTMAVVGHWEDGLTATASRYAPTLIPIAAVYFIAHYWTYLLYAGQATLGVLVDPLGLEWNPWGLGEYALNTTFLPGVAVWWTQVILIVVGHVMAVVAAHRVAVRQHHRPDTALFVQIPLVFLMVGYTVAGLWVLAQQLAPR